MSHVTVGWATLFCPPLAGIYAAWAQTTVPTLPSCTNFANNHFPKCGHPFVLSLSKHEWVIASFGIFRPSFDKLRTNGKFYREVSVGRSTLLCPPLAGIYTAWAQTTVPTLPSSKNFANNHFPKCGHPFVLSLSKHEWVIASFGIFRPSFDRLRTNGKFYRQVISDRIPNNPIYYLFRNEYIKPRPKSLELLPHPAR
ncbi:MAG: hypothetical protein Q8S55_00495 [Methylococcaceae bacterium]|nr:hypothetical protein [Methylococcaceae bacterium]